MTFLFVFLLAMFLPGWLLAQALRLPTCRGTVSIALSLSIFVVALLLARIAELGVHGLGFVLGGSWLLVAVGAALGWWLKPPMPERCDAASVWEGAWIIPVLTLGAVSGYMLWAGPYIEVPSDAWWHIGHIHHRLEMATDGRIGSMHDFSNIVEKQAGYWYSIAALLLYWSGTDIETGLQQLALANTLLFAAGSYSFALFVFRDIVACRWMRHWIATATVFFFITQFGISVFSYVRYYIYAPTVVNYIVYLAAIACVLSFIRQERSPWWYPVVALILGSTAALVHLQEAIFIAVMSGVVVLAEYLRLHGGRFSWTKVGRPDVPEWATRRIVTLLAILVIVYGTAHVWAFFEITRHNPLNHGVMADIRHYLPFLQNLYVLKPSHQFYQVLTVWGVLVYILFFSRTGRFVQSPFLIGGMAMPLLTVFNPVFTDLFLRFSWPEVLWRMCYTIPLPFVGAYFLVHGLTGVFCAPDVPKKGACLIVVAALLGLLLPIQSTYFISPYSKIYTLAPVSAENDHRIWRDLLHFLDSEHATVIVTDPVTGYVINGLTAHHYSGYKFYGTRTMPVDREAYSVSDIRRFRNGLVVINRRDGATSETGRHGRHWPPDVMQVSGHYSPAFMRFVADRSDLFELIWEQDRISVYRIIESQEGQGG